MVNKDEEEKQLIWTQEEIQLICTQLIKHYNITNKQFAKKVAVELKQSGIGIDKFSKEYDKNLIGLDEIVEYVIQKTRQKKIIPFENIKRPIPTKTYEEPAIIIDFHKQKSKAKRKIKISIIRKTNHNGNTSI